MIPVIADVIFPAFYFPYVAQLMNPLSAVAGLAAEYVVFVLLNRPCRRGRLLFIVALANVTSSVAGVALAGALPSGLNAEFVNKRTGPAHGPNWDQLAWAAWAVAFMLSLVIEYLVVRVLSRRAPLQRPGLSVILANAASYTVLIASFFLSVWWSWHR